MTTATAKRRTHQRAPLQISRSIRESVLATESNKPEVDWEAGVIRGVKVLGRTSPNTHGVDGVDGTEYTLDAMTAALPLYEGRVVNIDHPPREKPSKDRSSYDRFGKLVGCRVEESGIYADLHFLKTHPMARRICEAADKMPDLFGLSHNAYGKGEIRGRKYVIVSIPEVRSVDLVADAGSVTGLFESKEVHHMKINAYLKAVVPLLEAKGRRPILAKLLEDCGMQKVMEEDMPPMDDGSAMPAPEASTDPDAALKDGFRAAMMAVLDDDSMDAKGKLDKLKQLLTTHEKLTAQPDDASDVTEGDEEEDVTDDQKKIEESRKAREKADADNKLLREELAVTKAVAAANLTFIKPEAREAFIKSLVPLTESERKEMIEERKGMSAPPARGPRSQGQGARQVQESKAATDAASFLSAICHN